VSLQDAKFLTAPNFPKTKSFVGVLCNGGCYDRHTLQETELLLTILRLLLVFKLFAWGSVLMVVSSRWRFQCFAISTATPSLNQIPMMNPVIDRKLTQPASQQQQQFSQNID
jgi:hypothetical protein